MGWFWESLLCSIPRSRFHSRPDFIICRYLSAATATSRPLHQTLLWKMFAPLLLFAAPVRCTSRSRRQVPVPPANPWHWLQRWWAWPIRRQTLFIGSMARSLLLRVPGNRFHSCRQRRAPIPSLLSMWAMPNFCPVRPPRLLLWETPPEILKCPLRLTRQSSKQARAPRLTFRLFQ